MDIRDARLQQLLLLLDECGGKKTALATLLKRSPSQISQWLSGYRTITEDSAREIETNARKPRGWLDSPTALSAAPSPPAVPVPTLDHALPVVLQAIAEAPDRGRLRIALLALLDDDAPAYRQRLAELLAPETAEPFPDGSSGKRTGTNG